ncbi:hypothetical protein [Variovorax sp. Root411]|uniref:hypothetical protein n=1 Tax=Variovorax sp. Root411 TaxID=1736530 RepID=UPI000A83EC46|nr:hypothetical protein [Variovorax sp. Root411]
MRKQFTAFASRDRDQAASDPLPASVSRIEPRSSEIWLREVQRYFEAVESSLSSETPR